MYEVYRIVNTLNDKVYIGRSKDAKKRFKCHEYTANGGRGYKLHDAIRKYGINNFRLDILYSTDCIEDCVKKEEYFIKISDSFKKGYNASKGGFGELRSEESYRKLSKFYKGRKLTNKHRENISKSKKGNKLSFDHKRKLMKPLNRDIWNKGKKLTTKQKAKLQGAKRRPSKMVQIDNFCTFFSIKYAAEYIGTRSENITRYLNKSRKNKTNYKFSYVGDIILYNYNVKYLLLDKELV